MASLMRTTRVRRRRRLGVRAVHAGRRQLRRRRLPPGAAAARRVQAGRERRVLARPPSPGRLRPVQAGRSAPTAGGACWLAAWQLWPWGGPPLGSAVTEAHHHTNSPTHFPLPKQSASTDFDCFHLEPSNRSYSSAGRVEACRGLVLDLGKKRVEILREDELLLCVREEGKHVVEEMNSGLVQTSCDSWSIRPARA